jgi:hypothetical protein
LPLYLVTNDRPFFEHYSVSGGERLPASHAENRTLLVPRVAFERSEGCGQQHENGRGPYREWWKGIPEIRSLEI